MKVIENGERIAFPQVEVARARKAMAPASELRSGHRKRKLLILEALLHSSAANEMLMSLIETPAAKCTGDEP